VEKVVAAIHGLNHGWKLARELWGEDCGLALSLVGAKHRLQLHLVASAPSRVRVVADPEAPGTAGIRLHPPVGPFADAAHIPLDCLPSDVNVEFHGG